MAERRGNWRKREIVFGEGGGYRFAEFFAFLYKNGSFWANLSVRFFMSFYVLS